MMLLLCLRLMLLLLVWLLLVWLLLLMWLLWLLLVWLLLVRWLMLMLMCLLLHFSPCCFAGLVREWKCQARHWLSTHSEVCSRRVESLLPRWDR